MLMVIVYGVSIAFLQTIPALLLEKDRGGVGRMKVYVGEAVLCV